MDKKSILKLFQPHGSACHHWWVEAIRRILPAPDSKLIYFAINPHIVHGRVGPQSLSCLLHVIWNEQTKKQYSNIRVACGQRERHTHFMSTCRAHALITPSSFQFICLSSPFFLLTAAACCDRTVKFNFIAVFVIGYHLSFITTESTRPVLRWYWWHSVTSAAFLNF